MPLAFPLIFLPAILLQLHSHLWLYPCSASHRHLLTPPTGSVILTTATQVQSPVKPRSVLYFHLPHPHSTAFPAPINTCSSVYSTSMSVSRILVHPFNHNHTLFKKKKKNSFYPSFFPFLFIYLFLCSFTGIALLDCNSTSVILPLHFLVVFIFLFFFPLSGRNWKKGHKCKIRTSAPVACNAFQIEMMIEKNLDVFICFFGGDGGWQRCSKLLSKLALNFHLCINYTTYTHHKHEDFPLSDSSCFSHIPTSRLLICSANIDS